MADPLPPSPRDSGTEQPVKPAGRPVIQTFTLGPYQTNCYLVTVEGSKACWIVDASFGPGPIVEAVRDGSLEPRALILTHAHVDHIAGVSEVLSAFPGLPLWIHADERDWLTDPTLNLSALGGMSVTTRQADRLLQDNDTLSLSGVAWRIMHTPGHSPGGITLHCPDARLAIVGDALFSGSIGRTDFPGSDHDTLTRSIRERLYTLPGETRVLPGHGPTTTIAREKMSNPYVRG